MYRIKHFDLPSVALYSFILIFIVCLLFIIPFGLIFSYFAKLAQNNMPGFEEQFFPFMNFGFLFFFIITIVYAVIGAIVNTIIALIYNLLSLKLGGIKVTLDKVENSPENVIDKQVEGLAESQQ